MGVMTAIAATTAIISAASAGASFAQASKQRKKAAQAERDAQAAMADARKQLEKNYYDKLALPMGVYEAERQDVQTAMAGAISQAAEAGSRELVSTAGRGLQAVQASERAISEDEAQKLLQLEKLSATEESRLRDVGVQLDLEEVAGAQQAQSDAEKAAAAATAQGFSSATSALQQGLAMVPLYQQTRASKAMLGVESNYNAAAQQGKLQQQFLDKNGNALPFQQAFEVMASQRGVKGSEGVGSYSGDQWTDWMSQRGSKEISGYQNWSWLNPLYDVKPK